MTYTQAKLRAQILKAVAHPIRILLLEALTQRDCCVSELSAVAAVDQSCISRHLGQLRAAGIVTERREGTRVIYHLACPCILQAFECAVEVLRLEGLRRRAALKEGDS